MTELEKAAGRHTRALLEGNEPSGVYRSVLDQVERPMLDEVMRNSAGNQSFAAQALGINRATLRTKLKRHNLI